MQGCAKGCTNHDRRARGAERILTLHQNRSRGTGSVAPCAVITARRILPREVNDLPTERDVMLLGSRVLRPSRPRLKAVRAALSGITDTREAWEVLSARDLLPMSWLDDRTRRFRKGRDKVLPPSMNAVVTFAADPDGAMRAEELAREVVRRCAQLGFLVCPTPTVSWWFLDVSKPTVYSRRMSDVFGTLGNFGRIYVGQSYDETPPSSDRLSRALGDAVKKAHPEGYFDGVGQQPWQESWLTWVLRYALRDAWNLRGWRQAVRAGIRIPERPEDFAERAKANDDENVPDVFEGDWDNRDPNRRSFETIAWSAGWSDVLLSELPDVFAPLWALWETGYVLGDFTGQEIVLHAIEVTG